MNRHVNPLAFVLTDAIAAAAEPKVSLEDIIEWIGRRADQQYTEVQGETFRIGTVPEGMARELHLGRRAIDLMAKIIERREEVLFLLKAKPRHERGRPR